MKKWLWNFTCLILKPLLVIFCHFKIKGRENLNNLTRPFIIAAAIHANYLDPLFLSVAFPFGTNFFPIRFMVFEKLVKIPIIGSILRFYGAVPVIKKIGLSKSLEPFSALLKKGEIIGIFIEGRLSRNGQMGEVKPGAAFLAMTTNYPVLPMALSGTFGLNLKSFLLRQKKVVVTFGRPFHAKDFGFSSKENSIVERENLLKLTQIIENKIKELIE